MYIVIAIAGTIYLATLDDTDDLGESGSRRARSRGSLLKLIIDTVGQTGVIIIGLLVTSLLMYQLYTRYKQPAKEVVYSRTAPTVG